MSAAGRGPGAGRYCQTWAAVSTPETCPGFLPEESSSGHQALQFGGALWLWGRYSQPWLGVKQEDSGRGPWVSNALKGLMTPICPEGKTEPGLWGPHFGQARGISLRQPHLGRQGKESRSGNYVNSCHWQPVVYISEMSVEGPCERFWGARVPSPLTLGCI